VSPKKEVRGTPRGRVLAERNLLDLEALVLQDARSERPRLRVGRTVGRGAHALTVTKIGTHTVQYETGDGWSGFLQIPFAERGESLPSRRRALAEAGGGGGGARATRVRSSDKSIAGNVLYGHPTGDGGLRDWNTRDLERSYDLPPRWGTAILGLRDRARGMGETWYARQIATIRSMPNPESFSPRTAAGGGRGR